MRDMVRGVRPQAGLLYLLLTGISSTLIYCTLLVRFPLLNLYGVPLQNLNRLAPTEWPKGLLVIGCAVLLFAGYGLGALGLLRAQGQRRLAPLILGFPLIFVALLLLVQPVTSTDLYDYAFRGRMLAHYRANTFVIPPRAFADDPLFGYIAWPQWVTAYGPLWERMSLVAARLAGESPGSTAAPALLPLLLVYKALAALGFLGCGAAIWFALRRSAPEQRWLGLYLWLWNPLALWESVAAGHNDAWMALLIVLALAVLRVGPEPIDERDPLEFLTPIYALVLLAAGGMIKFVALFFGPVVLAAVLRRRPDWRTRWRLIVVGGLVCLMFVAVAYIPFWEGLTTLRNIGDRRTLFTGTWLAALHAALVQLIPEARADSLVAGAGMALLLAGVAWATWRAWRAPQDIVAHILWLALWFLFVCNPWFQPWYVIWPLALAALQPWRTRAAQGVGLLCLTALISYIIGGLVLPAIGFDEKALGRELLLSALLYIPPLIVLGGPRLSGWLRVLQQFPQTIGARRLPRPEPRTKN